jgi:hypothetical protein
MTSSEVEYLYALGHYPHQVFIRKSIMEMAKAVDEMEDWLRLRKAIYHMDVYTLNANFLFLDPDVAFEFKMRFA